MIAAQQYFIEYNADMNSERLLTLLPNYIPDYCLSNADKSVERWKTLVMQAYKKVRAIVKSKAVLQTWENAGFSTGN